MEEGIIEQNSEGVFLSLNEKGDKIPLYKDACISFENLAGAQAEVVLQSTRVLCKAKVPESSADLCWVINLLPMSGATGSASLEGLIFRERVGLNGKW